MEWECRHFVCFLQSARDHLFFECSYLSQIKPFGNMAQGLLQGQFTTTSYNGIVSQLLDSRLTPTVRSILRYVFHVSVHCANEISVDMGNKDNKFCCETAEIHKDKFCCETAEIHKDNKFCYETTILVIKLHMKKQRQHVPLLVSDICLQLQQYISNSSINHLGSSDSKLANGLTRVTGVHLSG